MGRSGLKRANGKAFKEDSRSNRTNTSKSAPAKAKAQSSKSQPQNSQRKSNPEDSLIPLELQQLLLNIFNDVFDKVLSSGDLQKTLQEVKGALYERDFEKAFGREEYLEAYSVRWSPSRALCYQTILADLYDHLRDLLPSSRQGNKTLHVVCYGGGAAEVVGFGGFLRYLEDTSRPAVRKTQLEEVPDAPAQGQSEDALLETQPEDESEEAPGVATQKQPEDTTGQEQPNDATDRTVQSHVDEELSVALQETKLSSTNATEEPLLDLTLLDIANWDTVVRNLHQGLITPNPSTTAPLLPPTSLATSFQALDALSLPQSHFHDHYSSKPTLLTLLFTLNELYTASISKTTAFLLKLTMAAQRGTLLLVVDSPGNYSEAKVGGGEGKKYPMKWLMDHALLDGGKGKKPEGEGKGGEHKDEVKWEKIVDDDSRWFRLPEALEYPIPLENMRYQIHLYRRL